MVSSTDSVLEPKAQPSTDVEWPVVVAVVVVVVLVVVLVVLVEVVVVVVVVIVVLGRRVARVPGPAEAARDVVLPHELYCYYYYSGAPLIPPGQMSLAALILISICFFAFETKVLILMEVLILILVPCVHPYPYAYPVVWLRPCHYL